MITPEYLTEIAAKAEARAEKLNVEITRRIAKRIVDSFYYDGELRFIPSTVNDMHKLMRLGMTTDEIQKMVLLYTP